MIFCFLGPLVKYLVIWFFLFGPLDSVYWTSLFLTHSRFSVTSTRINFYELCHFLQWYHCLLSTNRTFKMMLIRFKLVQFRQSILTIWFYLHINFQVWIKKLDHFEKNSFKFLAVKWAHANQFVCCRFLV